jgi:protein-disulfide isomerase
MIHMPAVQTKRIKHPGIEPVEEIARSNNSQLAQPKTIVLSRNQFYSALSVITFFAGIMVGYILWGARSSNNLVVDAPVRYTIPTDGSYATGPANAPITIVEFSDYQCPFCRQWYAQVYKQLLAAYPNKIKFVYRNFPLTSIHPEALPAAEAAMCAGEQNVYWQYHDKLFSSENLNTAIYFQYAQDLNLNMQAFTTCINNQNYKNAIQADSDFALSVSVNSTPTFFINGLRLVGAQPFDMFKQVIDKELTNKPSD